MRLRTPYVARYGRPWQRHPRSSQLRMAQHARAPRKQRIHIMRCKATANDNDACSCQVSQLPQRTLYVENSIKCAHKIWIHPPTL